MSIKRILTLLLTAVVAAGVNSTTAMAASRHKITSISMEIKTSIAPDDSISTQEAEITVKSSRIEVGEYEFTNDGFRWSEQDVPRLKVKLYAPENYYFSIPASGYTIKGGTYVSQKTEDYRQTLIVTIDLPQVGEFTQNIETAEWSSLTTASWSASVGAGSYEVKLYRDGKAVGTTKTTTETTYNFGNAMTKSGVYTFRVRPVNKKKPENVGDWKESQAQNIDEARAEQLRQQGAFGGWKQDEWGWWYQEADGTYPVSCWKQIKDLWYFFGDNGYMATGWVDWNGKQYYCDPADGHMLVSAATPDGAFVGEDGARLP